jgi:hypothetical protein
MHTRDMASPRGDAFHNQILHRSPRPHTPLGPLLPLSCMYTTGGFGRGSPQLRWTVPHNTGLQACPRAVRSAEQYCPASLFALINGVTRVFPGSAHHFRAMLFYQPHRLASCVSFARSGAMFPACCHVAALQGVIHKTRLEHLLVNFLSSLLRVAALSAQSWRPGSGAGHRSAECGAISMPSTEGTAKASPASRVENGSAAK